MKNQNEQPTQDTRKGVTLTPEQVEDFFRTIGQLPNEKPKINFEIAYLQKKVNYLSSLLAIGELASYGLGVVSKERLEDYTYCFVDLFEVCGKLVPFDEMEALDKTIEKLSL